MAKMRKDILYDLCVDKHESCFLAFDPSDYTEVRGYACNPIFEQDYARPLLGLANKALIFFSRASSSYEAELQKRYTRLRKRNQAKEVPLLGFNTTLFQAFKRDRLDFEEAVIFCCQKLREAISEDEFDKPGTNKDRMGFNDAEILTKLKSSLDVPTSIKIQTQSGSIYKCPQLLSAFTLWKVDRAILALEKDLAFDAVNLITDAHDALAKAQDYYHRKIERLLLRKSKSDAAAKSADKTHDRYSELEKKTVNLYKQKLWRSVKKAAEEVYDNLTIEEQKVFVSRDGALNTLWRWFSEADPEGKHSRYKKKKVPVSALTTKK